MGQSHRSAPIGENWKGWVLIQTFHTLAIVPRTTVRANYNPGFTVRAVGDVFTDLQLPEAGQPLQVNEPVVSHVRARDVQA